MIIGQLLMSRSDDLYSGVWFPRQGDGLLASFEVLNRSGGVETDFVVEAKNRQDADDAFVELATVNVSGVGTETVLATGCLELVRFRYKIRGNVGEWANVRALTLSWLRN